MTTCYLLLRVTILVKDNFWNSPFSCRFGCYYLIIMVIRLSLYSQLWQAVCRWWNWSTLLCQDFRWEFSATATDSAIILSKTGVSGSHDNSIVPAFCSYFFYWYSFEFCSNALKMHQNAAFSAITFQNFSGEGAVRPHPLDATPLRSRSRCDHLANSASRPWRLWRLDVPPPHSQVLSAATAIDPFHNTRHKCHLPPLNCSRNWVNICS